MKLLEDFHNNIVQPYLDFCTELAKLASEVRTLGSEIDNMQGIVLDFEEGLTDLDIETYELVCDKLLNDFDKV